MDDEILIICVDRDNDIGERLGVEGPIFGRKENLEVAKNLALEDPEESDANCLFGAINEYDKLKKQDKKVQIVTLLGDKNVGTVSDTKITEQLDKAISKYNPKGVIFVSDGAEDEYVLPIIQSKLPILSIRKIIVKQSSQLESGYYLILKFIKETLQDPQMSRVILGIPAIILILYSLFGGIAWRAVVGVVGIYLIIKGFHLENFVSAFIQEMSVTFSKDKLSFFCYVLGVAFSIVGIVQGYSVYNLYLNSDNYVILILRFLEAGLIYYMIAGVFVITGRLLHIFGRDHQELKYLTYYALLFSIYIVLANAIKYTIQFPNYNVLFLVMSVIIGFLILLVSLITERILFSKE